MVCAILLAKRGKQVIILDSKPTPSKASFDQRLAQRDARVYALNLSSIDLLKVPMYGTVSPDAPIMTKCMYGRR